MYSIAPARRISSRESRASPRERRIARAIYVGIAEARDLGALGSQALAHRLVEQELRVAIDVERRLASTFLAKHPARAVHGGGGGIDEGHAVRAAPFEESEGVAVI